MISCQIKQKNRELLQEATHDLPSIWRRLTQLRLMLTELSIKPCNLWNLDETGFRLGVDRKEYVIVIDRRAWFSSVTE